MSKIRIVAERRSAGSGTYSVNRKFCRCRRANINVEGMRASDNAVVHFAVDGFSRFITALEIGA